jgi:uncharacterized protein (DUF1778 family)
MMKPGRKAGTKTRSERVEVRLTPDQRRALEELAAARRTTLTGAFCMLIDEAYSQLGADERAREEDLNGNY